MYSSYDTHYFRPPRPPAPVVLAEVFAPFDSKKKSEFSLTGIPMLLDSGSDITLIPVRVINELGNLPKDKPMIAAGVGGFPHELNTYYVKLCFPGLSPIRIRVAEFEGVFGVIGRDILNELLITLDGKELRWRAE